MNTKDIKIENIKVLIWGKPKSGKTYSFRTFPKPAKAYMFDPGGVLALRGEDIDYEVYEGAAGFRRFNVDRKKDAKEGKYASYMVDSLTTLQDSMMKSVQEENPKATETPQIQEYALYFIRLRALIIEMLSMKANILFTAHEQMVKDEVTGDVFIAPFLYGRSMPNEVPVYFDEYYHAEVRAHRKEPTEFLWRTSPNSIYACGSRLAKAGVLDNLEPSDFNVIKKKILGDDENVNKTTKGSQD